MKDDMITQIERENAELKSRIDNMCLERQKIQIEQTAHEVASDLPSSVSKLHTASVYELKSSYDHPVQTQRRQ